VKINEQAMNILSPQTGPLYEVPEPGRSSTYAPKGPVNAGDQIDLASQPELMSQTQSAGAEEQASRTAQLRAAFQSGQYQVDTGALSQSIVGAMANGY
jgi:anti-sigma28 factor (negative regulator of flagellin synthesis)